MVQKSLRDLSSAHHCPSHYHPPTWISVWQKHRVPSSPGPFAFAVLSPDILWLASFAWLAQPCLSGHDSASLPHCPPDPADLFNPNYTSHASGHTLCHCRLRFPCLLICTLAVYLTPPFGLAPHGLAIRTVTAIQEVHTKQLLYK